MTQHLRLPRLKKGSSIATKQSLNKKSGILLFLEYHIFLQSLMKEVSIEARNKRSKIIRREHVRAVGKRLLRKFKP